MYSKLLQGARSQYQVQMTRATRLLLYSYFRTLYWLSLMIALVYSRNM